MEPFEGIAIDEWDSSIFIEGECVVAFAREGVFGLLLFGGAGCEGADGYVRLVLPMEDLLVFVLFVGEGARMAAHVEIFERTLDTGRGRIED